jgi:hypothetical protein
VRLLARAIVTLVRLLAIVTLVRLLARAIVTLVRLLARAIVCGLRGRRLCGGRVRSWPRLPRKLHLAEELLPPELGNVVKLRSAVTVTVCDGPSPILPLHGYYVIRCKLY